VKCPDFHSASRRERYCELGWDVDLPLGGSYESHLRGRDNPLGCFRSSEGFTNVLASFMSIALLESKTVFSSAKFFPSNPWLIVIVKYRTGHHRPEASSSTLSSSSKMSSATEVSRYSWFPGRSSREPRYGSSRFWIARSSSGISRRD